jgi:hypothetical protein
MDLELAVDALAAAMKPSPSGTLIAPAAAP